jgi:hypothetical protein
LSVGAGLPAMLMPPHGSGKWICSTNSSGNDGFHC